MKKRRFHLPSARDIFGDNLEQIIPRLLLLIITFLYTGYFTYLKIEYWNFMLCSTDYAVIDSATHSTALGNFMWSTEANFNYWKQHIAPILLVFSFFYLFSDNYWFVFFVETLTIGLAAIPLFLIAARFLRDERLALLAVAAYFASGTLQIANLFDYHMESHEALFIFSAFYAMLKKRWGWNFFFIVLLTTCKEDAFIVASMIGLYAAVVEKEYKRAVYLWIYCGIYALLVFKVGYPYFRRDSGYEYAGYYSWMGSTPMDIVKAIITDPIGIIRQRLSNDYLTDRWSSFIIEHGVILPLFSPIGLVMLLPPSMELFLAIRGHLYGLTHHYPFHVIPIWSLAIVLALSNIKRGVEWISLRLDDKKWLSKARMVLSVSLGSAAGVYMVALSYYLLEGKFDFSVLSFRVRMDDAQKPLAILASVSAFLLILAPLPRITPVIGKSVAARAVFVILLFIIGAKLYYVKDYGALPVYSSWARMIATIDKDHMAKVKQMTGFVPHGAVVLTNAGAFAHLHHHTEAYIERYSLNLIKSGKTIDYALLDANDIRLRRPHQDRLIRKFLFSRLYGVARQDDGIFLFKRGHDAENNFRYYSDFFNTSAVRGAHLSLAHSIGEVVDDPSSPYGAALKATQRDASGGMLVYGPYLTLMAGEYKAVFRLKAGARTQEPVASLEVTTDLGRKIIGRLSVTGLDFPESGKWKVFELPFSIQGEPVENVELRVIYLGGVDVYADMTKLEISPESFASYMSGEEPDVQ